MSKLRGRLFPPRAPPGMVKGRVLVGESGDNYVVVEMGDKEVSITDVERGGKMTFPARDFWRLVQTGTYKPLVGGR